MIVWGHITQVVSGKLDSEPRVSGLGSMCLCCQVGSCVFKTLPQPLGRLFLVKLEAARGPYTHQSWRPIMSKKVEGMRMCKTGHCPQLSSTAARQTDNKFITILQHSVLETCPHSQVTQFPFLQSLPDLSGGRVIHRCGLSMDPGVSAEGLASDLPLIPDSISSPALACLVEGTGRV